MRGSKSCPDGCKTPKLPSLGPCFELRWGDGKKDRIETEDIECLCIKACNPHRGVTLKDVRITLSVILGPDNRLPEDLPDGTPSVDLKPASFISFGDLGPCRGEEKACSSRELALITRGAREGKYRLFVGVCYEVSFEQFSIGQFQFELVKS